MANEFAMRAERMIFETRTTPTASCQLSTGRRQQPQTLNLERVGSPNMILVVLYHAQSASCCVVPDTSTPKTTQITSQQLEQQKQHYTTRNTWLPPQHM
jgi:hypothetical protein